MIWYKFISFRGFQQCERELVRSHVYGVHILAKLIDSCVRAWTMCRKVLCIQFYSEKKVEPKNNHEKIGPTMNQDWLWLHFRPQQWGHLPIIFKYSNQVYYFF